MNPDFVTNIRKSDDPLMMTTNAGTRKMDLDGDVKGFGIAKYDPNQITNIFGFSHMTDMCRVTYDSSVEDAFIVHTANGIVKFNRDGRLYTYKPSQKYLNEVASVKGMTKPNYDDNSEYSHLISSVEGNKDGFTERQYELAKRVRKPYINTGAGGIDNFKHFMRQNIIKNCPVTTKDINI